MSKTILFTFDYELFLGDYSGTVPDCLIKPTRRLLEQLAQHSFKALFFIDTVYLLKLKDAAVRHKAAAADYNDIIHQLADIVRRGHEIHPHLHSHWLDASYCAYSNTWSLKERRYYQFSNLPRDRRTEIFDRSMQLLRDILAHAGVKQQIDAYRAGGWVIQPFDAFREHFTKHGIKHDFSVIPGKYIYTDVCYFDFRQAPLEASYTFSEDVCRPEKQGQLREWTISTYSLDATATWKYFKVNGIYTRLFKSRKTSGTVYNPRVFEEGDIYAHKNGSRRVASFEQLNPYLVWHYINLIRKRDYFHFISHPKLLFRQDSLMVSFLFGAISRLGNIETCFRKSRHIQGY